MRGMQSEMWTSMPGIIEAYNPAEMSATVQPALQFRRRTMQGTYQWETLALLIHCPVLFPSGGGYSLTFPITKGDECKVFFSMRCIDNWWSKGGVQTQAELRMHNASDGFVFVGPRSQPRVLAPNPSTSGVQLRSDDGQTVIEITSAGINFQTNGSLNINAQGSITISSAANIAMVAPIITEN